MTSRERVLTALNHSESDRVPIDLGGMRSTGIHAIAYKKLKEYIGVDDQTVKIYDVHQQLALVEKPVRERVHSDVVELKRLDGGFGSKINSWKERTIFPDGGGYLLPENFDFQVLPDGTRAIIKGGKVIAAMPSDGYYFDRKYFPLAGVQSKNEIDRVVSLKITTEELSFLRTQATELKSASDCAIIGSFGGNFLEAGHKFFGYREFMERMITDRPLVEYFLDKLLEEYLQNAELYLSSVGGLIDLIQLGDDYGSQESTQISPKIFRALFKPRLKKLCDFIHSEKPGVFVFLHSCGSVSSFITDFIEAGIQVLNPVQTNAKNMDPVTLKREFGKDIVFWGGGCDSQRVLPFGSLADVEEDVKRRLDVFAPGGGYVFASIHNIQPEIQPEKVLKLFDSALEYGEY